jgi:hypothetical protein
MTYASHVEDLQPVIVSHAGGMTLVTMSHIDVTSPTSVHHLGDDSLTFSNHDERMSPTIVNGIGGIHTIEKPKRLSRKPKFLCKTCEGNHLTHLCPTTAGIPEAWFSPEGPSSSDMSVVSPHLVSPLIDTTVMSIQSSPDHTSIVEGDVSPVPIITHHIQPEVEEVVVPVQPLVNPTLLLEGDASFIHVIGIYDTTHSEQERVLLPLSALSPIPGEVPFDWDGLVGYLMASPMSFQVRDIIRYIMKTVTSASTLSSSTWRAFGFPKIVSDIHKILTFHKSPSQDPWPPS